MEYDGIIYNGEIFYSLENCVEAQSKGKGYVINQRGEVLSVKNGLPRKLLVISNSKFELLVNLFNNGNQLFEVAKLVYSVFHLNGKAIPFKDDDGNSLELDFTDGNPLNVHADNLQLVPISNS